MFSIQYHCSCCEQVVSSSDRDCPNCGSHNIRTPYGFWILCVFACLAVAIVIKLTQVYFSTSHEIPKPQSFVQVISDHHKE